jgi:hypothetical protein
MPDRPATIPAHVSGAVRPNGVTAPMPVMTTRRRGWDDGGGAKGEALIQRALQAVFPDSASGERQAGFDFPTSTGLHP